MLSGRYPPFERRLNRQHGVRPEPALGASVSEQGRGLRPTASAERRRRGGRRKRDHKEGAAVRNGGALVGAATDKRTSLSEHPIPSPLILVVLRGECPQTGIGRPREGRRAALRGGEEGVLVAILAWTVRCADWINVLPAEGQTGVVAICTRGVVELNPRGRPVASGGTSYCVPVVLSRRRRLSNRSGMTRERGKRQCHQDHHGSSREACYP
jgi:hypothetical protein